MRPLYRWLALVVLLAVLVVAGTIRRRARADDVITFQFNNLSATIQPALEVPAGALEERRSPSGLPARTPFESRTAAAVIAVAGLALALQQRARSKNS
jgi:hypothetical protein